MKRLKRVSDEADSRRVDAMIESEVWATVKKSGLYPLLIKSSSFMEDSGRKSLARFVLGLKLAPDGTLVYPRYEELDGVLDKAFFAKWQEEYRREFKPEELAAVDGGEGRKVMEAQVISQVGAHAGQVNKDTAPDKIPEAMRGLPERVNLWLGKVKTAGTIDSANQAEAGEILKVFEINYFEIRKVFGDSFANIRTDLRNYIGGLSQGSIVAKRSERFEVTGDVIKIALSGSLPVYTCQNMEYAWVNQRGQPVHRLIHGQFKVANWEVDGVVAARRLVEVTVDEQGREHLLVENLYVMKGFARVAEFRRQIIDYAKNELGISKENVHFSDEDSRTTAPPPMKPGDEIYRDTFRLDGPSLDEVRDMRVKKEAPKKKVRRRPSTPYREHTAAMSL